MLGDLMGITFPIIKSRVGEGGQKRGDDVKRIQQLLRMGGFLKTNAAADGVWTQESTKALLDFQNQAPNLGQALPYIEPKDRVDRLAILALYAKVLIPLPLGMGTVSAVNRLYETCRGAKYEYGWAKGDATRVRVIWGFEGRPKWAVATTVKKFFAPERTITLNCTSFANLMMSVWLTGSAHRFPYDASQQVGDSVALGSRYRMQPLNDGNMMVDGYCYDLPTIEKLTKPNKLYHFASSDLNGDIKHDMVLLNGEVYECNIPPNNPAVFKTPLAKRFNMMINAKDQRVPRIFGEL